jgi:hypothetical protein
MSGHEWKMKLHLSYAGELRSMAEKMRGVQTKALLLSIADDHEQLAKSLQEKVAGDQRRTGTAA